MFGEDRGSLELIDLACFFRCACFGVFVDADVMAGMLGAFYIGIFYIIHSVTWRRNSGRDRYMEAQSCLGLRFHFSWAWSQQAIKLSCKWSDGK